MAEFYLRGLEYYVIDGVAAALAKYTLRKKILAFNVPVPFHIRQIPKIPFTFYAKTYADGGYSYITKSNLIHSLITGYCIPVVLGSISSMYTTQHLSLEYSFNQLGENGLFFTSGAAFKQ